MKKSCGRRTVARQGRRSRDRRPRGIGGPSPLRFGGDELSHERPRWPAAVTESLFRDGGWRGLGEIAGGFFEEFVDEGKGSGK
jgi:hypothetical protein